MSARAPITVLHVAPTPFFSDRGCHIRIRGIIEALQDEHLHHVLCTYHHGRDVPDIVTCRIPRIPGYNHIGAGPHPMKFLADLFLLFLVWRTIIRRRPQIIHGHLHEGALIGWLAKWLCLRPRLPVVFDVQGSLVGELATYGYFSRGKLIRRLFSWVEWLVTRLPDRFVCSSQAVAEHMQTAFGVASERIAVAPDGPHPGLLGLDTSATAKREAKRVLGIDPEIPVVAYTGSLLPGKGVDLLHDVLLQLADRKPAVHVLLVGYPTENTAKLLRRYELTEQVTLAGQVPYDELPRYLAAADVALEPKPVGAGEASGKLVSYMAAGLPVVCGDYPTNRAMLEEDGYYCTRYEPETFADTLLAVLADLNTARQNAAKARRRTHNVLSWKAGAATIRRLYAELHGPLGSVASGAAAGEHHPRR